MTTRITYVCPDCGDPDAPDALHSVHTDATTYWNARRQCWEPEAQPNTADIWCSECGEISRGEAETELPDLSPLEELEIAREIARDLECQTDRAWKKARELEADIEAREAAHKREAARRQRLADAAPELLSLLSKAIDYSELSTLEHDPAPDFVGTAKDLFRKIEGGGF